MPKAFSLCKDERLYLREAISELFAKGSSFTVFPYRIIYNVLPEDDPQVARVAIMTIAPKKKFKHAVDRNHVKRLTREAYRINKLPLIEAFENAGKKLQVAFIYSHNQHITFQETEKHISKGIQLIIKKGLKKAIANNEKSAES